jgi:hypothetical protein
VSRRYSGAVHEDEFETDEVAEVDDEVFSEQEVNGHMLSIRRADGEEIVSIQATGDEEWSVHLEPGGAIRSAYIGARGDSPVWLSAWDRHIERDEDGTYVIRLG